VDDALAVGEGEAGGGLPCDAQGLGEGQRPGAGEALGEVRALDVLEGQVEGAVLLAGVEQGDDVGVDQAAGGLRLAQQALAAVGDLRRLVGDSCARASPGVHATMVASTRGVAARRITPVKCSKPLPYL
jgi:hypothetical protein